MISPTHITVEDNYQLIHCHCQNIRQLLAKVTTYALTHKSDKIAEFLPNIHSNAKAIANLAEQLVEHEANLAAQRVKREAETPEPVAQ